MLGSDLVESLDTVSKRATEGSSMMLKQLEIYIAQASESTSWVSSMGQASFLVD